MWMDSASTCSVYFLLRPSINGNLPDDMYPERNLLLYGNRGLMNSGNYGIQSRQCRHHSFVALRAFNGGYREPQGTNDDAGGNTGFLFDQSMSDTTMAPTSLGRHGHAPVMRVMVPFHWALLGLRCRRFRPWQTPTSGRRPLRPARTKYQLCLGA